MLEGAGEQDAGFVVFDNVDRSRFELLHNDVLVSFASYSLRGDVVVIPHVETAPAHRGNGYAARLMDGLLDILRATNRTVVPVCPFAAQHIGDNPPFHDLVAALPKGE